VSEASLEQGSHLDEAVDEGRGVELGFAGGLFADHLVTGGKQLWTKL